MSANHFYQKILFFNYKIYFDNQKVKGNPATSFSDVKCRLLKYNKEDYARIGVMPRYGDADSIKWFEVEPNSIFHIFYSFEDGDEVTFL